MKFDLMILLTLLILSSCNDEPRNCYKKIDERSYSKYKPHDTLYNFNDRLITMCKDTIPYFDASVMLMKKVIKNKASYYLFDPDAYLENDSTIIWYAPAFKATSDSGGFFKNGVWLYAAFYTDEKDSSKLLSTSSSGVKLVVDSMPSNTTLKSNPTTEGIYFARHDSLIKLSSDQSEDKFYSLNINGFYYFPNPGRLFKRININEIE